MRGNPHVRFGGRAEETDRPKGRHRASVRPNHAGNTWAAATGASTRELMARMGHSNSAAALRYQHATADRDRAIADALSAMAAPADVMPIAQRVAPTRDQRAIQVGEENNRSPRKGS